MSIINKGSPDSELQIGPYSFTHAVQSISINEQKAIRPLETTRTAKNLIADSGQSSSKAEIRFLFTGLEEINKDVRTLLALFKTSPITVVKNEMITRAWNPDIKVKKRKKKTAKKPDEAYVEPEDGAPQNNENEDAVSSPIQPEEDEVVYTPYTPVTLEEISISTVPDIPFAIYLTLIIANVDVSYATSGNLTYMSGIGTPAENPADAYWLTKWIDKILTERKIPILGTSDFSEINFDWFGQDILGANVDSSHITRLNLGYTNPDIKIQSESCSIRNLFAYHNLAGRGTASPQHMGSTARFYSIDIVVNEQSPSGTPAFELINKFKAASDKMARSKRRENRITGWDISSPIAKILHLDRSSSSYRNGQGPLGGIFVPMSVISETSEHPMVKTIRIDFVENNIDFHNESELIITSGGTDYDSLKNHFDKIASNEYTFRTNNYSTKKLTDSLTGQSILNPEQFDSFSVFWPSDGVRGSFTRAETFGLLTKETIKAVFLHTDFDYKDKLRIELEGNKLISGKAVIGNRELPFYVRNAVNIEQVNEAIRGPNSENKEHANLYLLIKDYVESKMIELEFGAQNTTISTDLKQITDAMFYGFFGDFTSAFSLDIQTGGLIQMLSRSKYGFSKLFKDTLFKVIVERLPAPVFARPAYDEDAIITAFFKLATDYAKYAALNEPQERGNVSTKISNPLKKSLYPDLYLPRYQELYGDKWRDFAPTYDDVGLINPNIGAPTEDTTNAAGAESRHPQQAAAVGPNDFVSPGAWFWNKKFKTEIGKLHYHAKAEAILAGAVGHELVLSLPFDEEDVQKIEKLLADSKLDKNDKIKKEALFTIIKRAFDRSRTEDGPQFIETMNQLALASQERYKKLFIDPASNNIAVEFTTKSNVRGKRYLTMPGLGAELYSVASELKLLKATDRLPHLDTNDSYKSANQASGYEFIRNAGENTQDMIRSSIDQIADTHESAVKMFPACKVYLLEKRGTDLVGDDSFFAVNPIISIDITLDKDDADLAVIRVADPLYILQRDYFSSSNVLTVKGEAGEADVKTVLNSLKGSTSEGYLKRYKIAQGRAVQIKMGYDSNPDNLQTVFTGRIAEIEPGDVITIVAQGWKAELINRQVAFSNANPKAWGAKDLAVQTIVAADPAGFGDYYAQRDTNFILRNLARADMQEIAKQVLRIQEGSVDVTEQQGTRSATNEIANWFRELFGVQSLNRQDVGLDTRLKNIWYPETVDVNNALGWRSFWKAGTSDVNDGWIIPLQPAWDALKEAARHTWGCIVQVVPYDGEATIFFGQPDQPYFFTKGNSVSRRNDAKHQENLRKATGDSLEKMLSGFKSSKFYASYHFNFPESQYTDHVYKVINFIIKNDLTNILHDKTAFPIDGEIEPNFKLIERIIERSLKVEDTQNFVTSYLSGPTKFAKIVSDLDASQLPYEAYINLKNVWLKQRTVSVICKLFFGIEESDLHNFWPSVEQDFDLLLTKSPNHAELEKARTSKKDIVSSNFTLLRDTQAILDVIEDRTIFPGRDLSFPLDFNLVDGLLSKLIVNSSSNIISSPSIATFVRRIQSTLSLLKPSDQSGRFVSLRLLDQTGRDLRDIIKEMESSKSSGTHILGTVDTEDFSEIVMKNRLKLKAFVYYLDQYLSTDIEMGQVSHELSKVSLKLPSTMKVFRVHHHVDNNHDIIKNSIVASTRDMWNTVSIEHPARGAAYSKIDGENLHNKADFFSGIEWVYGPKKEITGVMGLQFHPGLTLANKKLKIFTELNVQSEELEAKVACNRLAEGIKKMYRGTLTIKGRHIKPYDRIILNDDYTNMVGPIEAESVIHHWSADLGWVTNIIPQAVCDANPGAGILQTAAMEAAFGKVYKTIDYAADILTLAIIVGTLGTATAPAAVGGQVAKRGVIKFVKDVVSRKFKQNMLARLKALPENVKRGVKGGPMQALLNLVKAYGIPIFQRSMGVGIAIGGANQLTNTVFKMTVASAYVRNAQEVKQMPVIITPLLFNGMPFLAGLETDDPIWSIYFNEAFHGFRELQAGAAAFLEEAGWTEFQTFDSTK